MRDVVPPPVPDESNFALQPALAPLFDFNPGTQKWRDSDAFPQLENRSGAASQRAKVLGYVGFPGSPGNWRKGETADMNRLLGVPDEKERSRLLEHNARLMAKYKLAPNESGTIDLSAIPEPVLLKYNLTNRTSSSTNLIPIRQPMDPSAAASNILALFTESPTGAWLDELQTARRQRSQCRFNILYEYPNPAAILLPHLALIKSSAQSYRARALARLHLGKIEAAFEDTLMALILGEYLRAEPFPISHLVRIACREIALQPVWEGLASHRWTAPQLVQFQAVLEDYDLAEGTRRILNGERVMSGVLIDALRCGTIKWEEVIAIGSFLTDDPKGNATMLAWLYPRGWLYQEQIFVDRFYRDALDNHWRFDNGLYEPTRLNAFDAAMEKEMITIPWKAVMRHRLLASVLLPPMAGTAIKAAISQTANNLALIACALEQYHLAQGRYPAKLEALVPAFLKKLPVDVINGRPLNYQTRPEGTFHLYSVGLNNQDEEGLVVIRPSGPVNMDKGDWVWSYTPPMLAAEK